ncbi:MAG: hypothetical protein QM496_12105 [Verrucomicrobiota bacterium]
MGVVSIMCEFIGKFITPETFTILIVFTGTMAMTYYLAGLKLYTQKLEDIFASFDEIRRHLLLPIPHKDETENNYINRVEQQAHKLGISRLRPATLSKLYFKSSLEQFGKLDKTLKAMCELKKDIADDKVSPETRKSTNDALAEKVVTEINSITTYLHSNKGALTNPLKRMTKVLNSF